MRTLRRKSQELFFLDEHRAWRQCGAGLTIATRCGFGGRIETAIGDLAGGANSTKRLRSLAFDLRRDLRVLEIFHSKADIAKQFGIFDDRLAAVRIGDDVIDLESLCGQAALFAVRHAVSRRALDDGDANCAGEFLSGHGEALTHAQLLRFST